MIMEKLYQYCLLNSVMTRYKNAMISKFPKFERKICQILQNSKNWRNNIFTFIDVSPKIFMLQRLTIPHSKAWNKLFWPFLIHFSAKSDISWSAEQNTCIIFWTHWFQTFFTEKNFHNRCGLFIGYNLSVRKMEELL